VISALLLLLAILILTLEPKIFEIAVDYVMLNKGSASKHVGTDFISNFFFQWLDPVYGLGIGNLLMVIAAIYIITAMLRGGIWFASSRLNTSTTENAMFFLRNSLFSHIQRIPVRYFTSGRKGELIQRYQSDLYVIKSFFQNQIVNLIRLFGIFIFSFIMMAIVNIYFALISICVVPLILWWSFKFYKTQKILFEESQMYADQLIEISRESFSSMRSVIASSAQPYEIDKFGACNSRKFLSDIKNVKETRRFMNVNDFLLASQLTISLFATGYFAFAGYISIGQMLSFYAYTTMVAWPLSMIGSTSLHVARLQISIKHIMEIWNFEKENEAGDQADSNTQFHGHIEFKNVCFKYPNSDKWSLEDVTFTLLPGEKIGIIGPSGSGKSTIFNLLLRFYEPTSGMILVDGKPIQAYKKEFIREKIGCTFQNSFLFSTTLKENIIGGRNEVSALKFNKVTETCSIGYFNTLLPKGFDTNVGEKGFLLSGGQRQRLSLARTLIADPHVLLLDNANSALDSSTEKIIFDKIFSELEGKTVLFCTHRFFLIDRMDRILVFKNGRVVQSGTPETLRSQWGYFKDTMVQNTINNMS